MLIPTQLAAAVMGALLSACVFLTGPEPAWARPIMTPGDAAATTALPVSPVEPQQAAPPPRGHAYLFRGALGPIFSRGMDSLTDQLEHAGIKADVYEFTICRLIAAQGHCRLPQGSGSDRFDRPLDGRALRAHVRRHPARGGHSGEPRRHHRPGSRQPEGAAQRRALYQRLPFEQRFGRRRRGRRCRAIRGITPASTSQNTRKSPTSISTRWNPSTSSSSTRSSSSRRHPRRPKARRCRCAMSFRPASRSSCGTAAPR